MALIIMCAYCTEENGKLKYLKQTLESLASTVNGKHRVFIINNFQYQPAIDWLNQFNVYGMPDWKIIYSPTNLGTAMGINLALKERRLGEYCIKCDDDWTTEHVGWVEEMEAQIEANPQIGILGLRRDDVYGELIPDGELFWNRDIMGTCTMLNHRMLDKVGYYFQPSGTYGYDDSILSCRSEVAGFKNAFMRNIKIKNLDEGGTEYTEWKKREANTYAQEAGIIMDMYRSGQLDYYYNPYE